MPLPDWSTVLADRSYVLDPAVTRARRATAATFAINGVLLGSYASRIPGLKTTLRLSDSGLGRLLFAVAVGALVMLQVAGRLVGRFGSARASAAGAAVCTVGFAVLGATDVVSVALASMFVMGLGFSLLDVAMNSQAVFVEVDYRRPLMNSFHAAFSVGSLVGAGAGALIAHADIGQQRQYVLSAIAVGVAFTIAVAGMRRDDPDTAVATAESESVVGVPVRSFGFLIAVFGAIAFAGMLSEGAAADWSGVHLRDTLGWTEGRAAQGFVVFQIFMVAGRLAGDRVVHRLGARRVLVVSSAITAVGFGIGLAADSGWMFVAGLGALGLGLAVIVPVVFSTAAAASGDAGAAIARVSTIGYAGFLVGPPVLGQLAEWTSTTWALATIPLLGVVALVTVLVWVERPTS